MRSRWSLKKWYCGFVNPKAKWVLVQENDVLHAVAKQSSRGTMGGIVLCTSRRTRTFPSCSACAQFSCLLGAVFGAAALLFVWRSQTPNRRQGGAAWNRSCSVQRVKNPKVPVLITSTSPVLLLSVINIWSCLVWQAWVHAGM